MSATTATLRVALSVSTWHAATTVWRRETRGPFDLWLIKRWARPLRTTRTGHFPSTWAARIGRQKMRIFAIGVMFWPALLLLINHAIGI